MTDVRFLVVDMVLPNGDEYITECSSLEDANAEARKQWNILTEQEQSKRNIFVAAQDEDEDRDLPEGGWNSNGLNVKIEGEQN